MGPVAGGPSAWLDVGRHPRRKWRSRHPCAATAFRPRPSGRRLHDSSRSYLHHSSFLSASVAGTSGHQLFGHRCQLLVGLDHQQVPHFAGDDGHLGIIAWRSVSHDGDGRCLRRRRPAGCLHAICACRHGCHRSFHHCPSLGSRTGGRVRCARGLVCADSRPAFFRNAGPRSCSGYSRPYFPNSGRNIADTHVPRCGSTIQWSCRNRIANLAADGQLFASWLDDWLAVYREILVYVIRALPKMIVSILMLIVFCGGLAFALVEGFDIDPLTAYLATSPGGADSVAIIAASTNVDVGFVMAQQIARFMLVLIIGPALSRFVADRIARNVPNIS